MAASMADVEHSQHRSGLPGRCQHCANTALQRGNLLLYRIKRRVAQTGVKETGILQIKQSSHCLRGFIPEGGALYNRHHTRLPVAGMISRVNALCIHTILAHF